jgi:hypothetical protein
MPDPIDSMLPPNLDAVETVPPPSLEERLDSFSDVHYCLLSMARAVDATDLDDIIKFLRSNKVRKRKWADQLAHVKDSFWLTGGGL